MIAATAQAPNPLSFLGEFMPPEIAPPALPADFAALLAQLKLVPATGEGMPAEAPVALDTAEPDTGIETEADSGPVPDGLEEVADTLAAALAAVLAAAGKPAQTTLSHRPGTTTKVAKEVKATATVAPEAIAPATMALAAIALPEAAPTTPTTTPDPELVSGSTPPLAPPSPEARWMLKQACPELSRGVQHDEHFAEVLSRAPAAAHGAEASLAPIIARIQAATMSLGKTPPAPLDPITAVDPAAPAVDSAAVDQPAPAIERPVALPLPATTLAPPLAAPAAIPTAAAPIDTASIQPQSSSEIAMTHHLDLAKDNAWLDTLARDIARTASHGAQLRFQLNPEHLGSLHVELANGADGTAIRLTADTDAARNILADAQPRLIAEARAQGLRISEAQVDLGNHGGRQRDHQENPQPVVIRTQQPRDEQAAPAPRSAAERYA